MTRFPNSARVCFIGDSITHNNLFLAHIVSYYRIFKFIASEYQTDKPKQTENIQFTIDFMKNP